MSPPNPRSGRPMPSAWTLTQHARHGDAPEVSPVAARVPGCTHTDLLAAGVIPDPYVDTNEQAVQWVGECDWRYRCEIVLDDAQLEADRVDLAFDGLDTIAEIAFNGVEVGRTENMHRRYRFDVRHLATTGVNTLEIVFRSAMRHADALFAAEGDWPSAYDRPFNYVRKSACSWGWDWGPWLTSAGVWRPARVETWSVARLAAVRPHVSVDATDTGSVVVDIDLETSGDSGDTGVRDLSVGISLARPDGSVAASVSHPLDGARGRVEINAGTVERWWPHTHGAQPLYELAVELRQGDATIDRTTRRVAFRTIVLDTTTDDIGSAFTIVVNDRPIFARGVNWIPDDTFPARITSDRYRTRLEQAVAANSDLVRVWGGGLYEDEAFYDACDELGLLVWQDFPFACATYPEHLLRDEVEAEARDNVTRLMSHPSLAIWNGNNENLWGHVDWGWQSRLDGRTWGAGFYFELLPAVVAELDPGRPYWPGSPYSGSRTVAPNADAQGCVHVWDTWNQLDLDRYRDHSPRFVAEFGWQAPPTWTTMTDAVSPGERRRDSASMRNHQKADDGDRKLDRGVVPRFGVLDDLDAWWYAAQVVQARAIRTGVEHFRSLRPWCMGTVWWQLNDCWPVVSWAVVDGAGRLKPSWYALRDAYRDRLSTIQPRGDELVLVAVNESGEPWQLDLDVRRVALSGERLAEQRVDAVVAPFDAVRVTLAADVAIATDPTGQVVVAGDGAERAWWWFSPDREIAWPSPEVAFEVDTVGEETTLVVTASTIVRDLCLFVDRLVPDATIDQQLISLLPGETTTIRLRGIDPSAIDHLTDQPVLWSAAHATKT